MIKFKKNKNTKGFSTTSDVHLVLIFIILASIVVYFTFGYVEDKRYDDVLKKSSVIEIQEDLIEINNKDTEFSYGMTKSYAIFSPREFFERCMRKEETQAKDVNLQDLYKLSFMTIEAYEVNPKTKIIKYKTPAYANIKCENFTYRNNELLYKNKPVYFLIKRGQNI